MKQLTVKILEFIGSSLWGFRPNLMRDIVEIHGSRASLGWFVKNMPKYEAILKAWGAERTHLLAVAISGINGCPYCTYGHALAFQLHYFERTNQLFPIDEQEMMGFNKLSEEEIANKLYKVFSTTGLTQESKDLQRLLVLKENATLAESKSDNNINQLIKIFGFLNHCGIQGQTVPDLAHDPINKHSKVCKAYQQARSRE